MSFALRIYEIKLIYTYPREEQTMFAEPSHPTLLHFRYLVRPSVFTRLWTAQLLKPWVLIHTWICIYARSLFMRIYRNKLLLWCACLFTVHEHCSQRVPLHSQSDTDSLQLTLPYWYLFVFSSGSFPYVIAPAFSTPAFSALLLQMTIMYLHCYLRNIIWPLVSDWK